MTEKPSTYLAGLAAAGSFALLFGALLSQYAGGLAPCHLCIWQRWPHAVAIALGALLLIPALREARVIRVAGALAALTTAGIGAFHTGVEKGWWEGPTTCVGGQSANMTTDQLLQSIQNAPLVRCDEVAWQFLSLSMASWNAILSLILAALWIASLRQGSSSASQYR